MWSAPWLAGSHGPLSPVIILWRPSIEWRGYSSQPCLMTTEGNHPNGPTHIFQRGWLEPLISFSSEKSANVRSYRVVLLQHCSCRSMTDGSGGLRLARDGHLGPQVANKWWKTDPSNHSISASLDPPFLQKSELDVEFSSIQSISRTFWQSRIWFQSALFFIGKLTKSNLWSFSIAINC